MNIESAREYGLSLPYVTEDMAFGPDCLLLRLEGKIFLCINLVKGNIIAVKCDPTYAIELRERHPAITGAYHWNKKYWNEIDLNDSLSDQFIEGLIRHSYSQVASKISCRRRRELPGINDIK